MRLILCRSYSKGARASDTEILRLTSSASKSVVVVPSSTRPWRGMAPAQKRRASASVVFPAPPWPTRATLRILAGGKLFIGTSGRHLGDRHWGPGAPANVGFASVSAAGGSVVSNFREHVVCCPGTVLSCWTDAFVRALT